MTAVITEKIAEAVHSAGGFGAVAGGGVVVAVVLAVLIVERQLTEAVGRWPSAHKRVLSVGIWPLVVTLAIVIVARFAHLVHAH